jgi:hypothetical protein
MIKYIKDVNILPILEFYSKIESNIVWSDYAPKGKQTGLQYYGLEDPWTSAVGPSRGSELEYNRLNPFFKDTILNVI